MTKPKPRPRTELVRVSLTPEVYSQYGMSAARMTAAEGRRVDVRDYAANALAYYEAHVRACLRCSASLRCDAHGSSALRPAEPPSVDVDGAQFKVLVDCYFSEYRLARGEDPPFESRDGEAVKKLLRAVGFARAEKTIRAVYADAFWRKHASIRTIADDPARHAGDTGQGSSKTSLQKASGFVGGKEVQ